MPVELKEFMNYLNTLFPSNQPNTPRSFAYGGIAGQDGEEIIKVGEEGPEAVIPLNKKLQNPYNTTQTYGSTGNLLPQNQLSALLAQNNSTNPTRPASTVPRVPAPAASPRAR